MSCARRNESLKHEKQDELRSQEISDNSVCSVMTCRRRVEGDDVILPRTSFDDSQNVAQSEEQNNTTHGGTCVERVEDDIVLLLRMSFDDDQDVAQSDEQNINALTPIFPGSNRNGNVDTDLLQRNIDDDTSIVQRGHCKAVSEQTFHNNKNTQQNHYAGLVPCVRIWNCGMTLEQSHSDINEVAQNRVDAPDSDTNKTGGVAKLDANMEKSIASNEINDKYEVPSKGDSVNSKIIIPEICRVSIPTDGKGHCEEKSENSNLGLGLDKRYSSDSMSLPSNGPTEILDFNDQIEEHLPQFALPEGATMEELAQLNSYLLTIQAIESVNEGDPTQEDMSLIRSKAEKLGIPLDTTEKIFQQVSNKKENKERIRALTKGNELPLDGAVDDLNQSEGRDDGRPDLQIVPSSLSEISPDDVKMLNYFHLMQIAMYIASSENQPEEKMEDVINKARQIGMPCDDMLNIFQLDKSKGSSSASPSSFQSQDKDNEVKASSIYLPRRIKDSEESNVNSRITISEDLDFLPSEEVEDTERPSTNTDPLEEDTLPTMDSPPTNLTVDISFSCDNNDGASSHQSYQNNSDSELDKVDVTFCSEQSPVDVISADFSMPPDNPDRQIALSSSISIVDSSKSSNSMDSMDQDGITEEFLTRKFTTPINATPEEIMRLNYCHLMQKAIYIASTKNTSKQGMDDVMAYASEYCVPCNDIMGIFDQFGAGGEKAALDIKANNQTELLIDMRSFQDLSNNFSDSNNSFARKSLFDSTDEDSNEDVSGILSGFFSDVKNSLEDIDKAEAKNTLAWMQSSFQAVKSKGQKSLKDPLLLDAICTATYAEVNDGASSVESLGEGQEIVRIEYKDPLSKSRRVTDDVHITERELIFDHKFVIDSNGVVIREMEEECASSNDNLWEVEGSSISPIERIDSLDNSSTTDISEASSFCADKYGEMENVDDNEEIGAFLRRFTYLSAGGHFPDGNVEGLGDFGKVDSGEDEIEVDLVYGFVKREFATQEFNQLPADDDVPTTDCSTKKQNSKLKPRTIWKPRGWAVKKYLKMSREERTKAHPGYSGVDVESLHRHSEVASDTPGILHTVYSSNTPGDWMGKCIASPCNEERQEHTTQADLPTTMPEAYIKTPTAGQIIVDIAKDLRKDVLNGDLLNNDDLFPATKSMDCHDSTAGTNNSGHMASMKKENNAVQLCEIYSFDEFNDCSTLSGSHSSSSCDDKNAKYSVGSLRNGSPNIDERVTRLHYSITSSYTKCK